MERRSWCRQADNCTDEMDDRESDARAKIKQAREELGVYLAEEEFGKGCRRAKQNSRGQCHRNTRPEVTTVRLLHSRKYHTLHGFEKDASSVEVQNKATTFD